MRDNNMIMYMGVGLGLAILLIIFLLFRSSSQPQPQVIMQPIPYPQQPQDQNNQMNRQMRQESTGNDKPALVMFYSNGCGHCRSMRPAWDKVQEILNQSGRVDAIFIDDMNEASKFNITGFPTLRLYPEGFPSQKFIEYQGNRSVDSIMKFVQSGGSQM